MFRHFNRRQLLGGLFGLSGLLLGGSRAASQPAPAPQPPVPSPPCADPSRVLTSPCAEPLLPVTSSESSLEWRRTASGGEARRLRISRTQWANGVSYDFGSAQALTDWFPCPQPPRSANPADLPLPPDGPHTASGS
jgi:hypothetical protein